MGVLVALCAALCLAPAASGARLKAKITRSAHGIPNIEAKNFESLGFGYGYAFAEDNICTIADSYVTTSAQRSRFFGPDARSPEGDPNLNADLFYQRVIDRGIVEGLVAQEPPLGRRAVRNAVAGYVKGYNRYLAKTGVENIPDPRCAGAEWVRPITEIDVYRRFYELGLYASSGVAISVTNAQPPAAAAGAAFERDRAAAARSPRPSATGSRSSARRSTSAAARSARTPGRSAARRRSPAAGWCSATRTSRGRARGASTSRI